jgi:signal transduction histidine kinase
MFASRLQVYLPRKITAYFLLFGLTAIVWLTIGSIYVAHAVNQSRSESSALRSLGRAANRFVLAYFQNGETAFQEIAEDVQTQSHASYGAVVSRKGIFLAHTQPELVSHEAPEHSGTTERWGDVIRVRYVGDRGEIVDEYQVPIEAGGKLIGMFRLGIVEVSMWSLVLMGAQFAPLAFIGPACCMAVGALLLNKMVRPVADIEHQLSLVAVSPSLETCEFSVVPSIGAAAMGWNRVVAQRLDSHPPGALRQRIRDSLHEGRKKRFDIVLNSLPEGVATTDREGKIAYINLPMSAILGMKEPIRPDDSTAPTTDSKMLDLLISKWQLPETDALLAEGNQDRPVVTELEHDENGRRSIIRVARHPIQNGNGSASETHVWTIRDVTQQKLAEEMRDQFVDTATHELRTPLANIKAYAETLELADVIDVEQQKQFLNTINSEATRLARFVDDLLSVSSMEVGSLTLNRQVTDTHRLLTEVVTKVQPQMEEKRLAFEVVMPEKIPELKIDKDKVATVLVNLIGNAVKYTPPEGRVAFRVSATDQQLEIMVEDSGVGIAADELPRVFEKFFRSDDPRVQEQKGTGLGLALAQEVIRLHGGRITAESELNKGSTFHVVLPIA